MMIDDPDTDMLQKKVNPLLSRRQAPIFANFAVLPRIRHFDNTAQLPKAGLIAMRIKLANTKLAPFVGAAALK
eukprot:1856487-Pyramimonas_sp.AAC.1